MASLGKAYVNIHANLKPLKRGLSMAFASVKASMKKMARVIKRGALLIVAAMTGAVVVAAKFQKQMAMISTMLDEKTMPLMEQFAKDVARLSVAYGQGTATLSKGLYDILSASIDASKAIDVLTISSRAAVAGMTETGVAADAITTIINSYAMSADDAAMISDKLFATVKRGKTTFQELAASIGRVASTASIAGMSFDELLATIATMTRAGINTTETMTSINGILRAFLSPTDEAKKAAGSFGLELSSTTLKTIGFLGAVKKLNKATPEMLGEIIPNIRAFKGLAAALKNVAGLTYDYRLISEDSAGKTAEAFDKMSKTASFRFGQMTQALLDASRAFGKELLPTVTYVMGRIKKFLGDNKETLKNWGIEVALQLGRFIAWLDKIANEIKTAGWAEAMETLMLDVSDALKSNWENIKITLLPKVKEIGRVLGTAFWEAFGEQGKGALWAIVRHINLPAAVYGVGSAYLQLGKAKEQRGEAAAARGGAIAARHRVTEEGVIGAIP